MAKQPKPIDPTQIELRPDGWDRFRNAVHAAAKSGPMHRQKPKEDSPIEDSRKD